jgi:hypothetical protein
MADCLLTDMIVIEGMPVFRKQHAPLVIPSLILKRDLRARAGGRQFHKSVTAILCRDAIGNFQKQIFIIIAAALNVLFLA